MNEEGDRIITRSKELLGRDRLDALEGKGRNSRIQDEMKATEKALKDLQTSFRDHPEQRRNIDARDASGISMSGVLRSPRSLTRDLLSLQKPGAMDTGPRIDGSTTSTPRSHLSREAQDKISQICSHRVGGENFRPGTVNLEDTESLVIWTARCKTGSVSVDKRPFPELVSVAASERRDLAPHISTIYDQVFFISVGNL